MPSVQLMKMRSQLSLEQLQKLFDASQDVICTMDAKGKFVYVSSASAKVWGYSPEELTGRPYMDFVVEEDREKTRQIAQRIVAGHNISNFENRYHRKDGSVVPITWSSHWDADQQRLIAIARDSTEKRWSDMLRHSYEAEIMHQNQQMREMMNRIDEGFYALDAQFTITYWNHQAEVLLERTEKEVLHQNLWEVFPEAVGTPMYANYHKALAEQIAVKFEVYFEPLQGWYNVDAYTSPEGLSIFFRNITEQKNTENRLRKLNLIAEQTSNLVILTDRYCRITWVNDAFIRTTGYSFDEVLGHKPGSLLQGPDTDPATIRYMSEQIRQEEPFTVEILNYNKEQQAYWLEIHCQPLYNGQGLLDGFFAIQTDISERKRLARELQEQQNKMRAAIIEIQERERSQVGQELHDNVNQVLTTVKLLNELCRDEMGNVQEIMNKSIKLLQDSINEIRSLSKRLSAPTLGSIKLKDSVQEMVDMIAATHKFDIQVNTTAIKHLEIHQDLHLAIYRILQEHLTNILKYAEANLVTISFALKKTSLVMVVTDNGKGFNPKQRSNGIGLANMRSRAEALKGKLLIDSAPGQGTELVVFFPLTSKKALAAAKTFI